MFPALDPHAHNSRQPRQSRERSLAARDERSESPVAGTQEGRTLTTAGRPPPGRPGPVGRVSDGGHRRWQHTGQMGAEEVTEYAARNQDGHWQVRVTRPGERYPAGQRARDQQALGPPGPHARREMRLGAAPRSGAALIRYG
jgi:hypothetical protein